MVDKEITVNIEIGMYVRSFDFDSRDLSGSRACYVEGVVEQIIRVGEFKSIECDCYMIAVNRVVFGGVEKDHGPSYVYPLLNGTPTLFGDKTNNVEVIHTVDEIARSLTV